MPQKMKLRKQRWREAWFFKADHGREKQPMNAAQEEAEERWQAAGSATPRKRFNHSLLGLGGEERWQVSYWRVPPNVSPASSWTHRLCVCPAHTSDPPPPLRIRRWSRRLSAHRDAPNPKAEGKSNHTQCLKHTSPSVYISARGNMMFGVKLFIDPFRAGPRLLVSVSCLGLCMSVSTWKDSWEKRQPWDGPDL